jgi:hypothetical protein
LRALSEKRYMGSIDRLPPPEGVRNELDAKLGVCRDRPPGLILVEEIDDHMVLIAVPDGKTERDFRVWRSSPDLKPRAKIPTHDDLGKTFAELKGKYGVIDEHLINAILKILRDRWSVDSVIDHHFSALSNDLKTGVKKFLATLRWVGLQEAPATHLRSTRALK